MRAVCTGLKPGENETTFKASLLLFVRYIDRVITRIHGKSKGFMTVEGTILKP